MRRSLYVDFRGHVLAGQHGRDERQVRSGSAAGNTSAGSAFVALCRQYASHWPRLPEVELLAALAESPDLIDKSQQSREAARTACGKLILCLARLMLPGGSAVKPR